MRKFLVAALIAAFALGMAGMGCDEGTKTCFPITCFDDSQKRVCDPPSCATQGCDTGYSCETAASGEQICIDVNICN